MIRRLVVDFTKMNGAGNDFIVVDNRFYHFSDEELSDLARKYCKRRTGIGADGLLGFNAPQESGHDYRMRYFNADGSLGTMCGNGARCLARFARWAGMERDELVFESDAGVYRAVAPAEPEAPVQLFVQPPQHYQPGKRLDAGVPEGIDDAHYIWTGVEHLVCYVPSAEGAPVGVLGPVLRRDPALGTAGANVNFVEVLDDGAAGTGEAHLRVRTYEKGVEEETLACGTGAMASAVVSRYLGHVAADVVRVHMPGGVLGVGMTLDDGAVQSLYLEGPAEIVFRGTFEL